MVNRSASVPVGEPDVVFIVPTLGQRPDWLRQTLLSVASQTGVAVKIVVVGPAIAAIQSAVDEIAATFVAEPQEKGLSAAINYAAECFGRDVEYIAWIGDDDVLAPGSLQKSVAAMRARPRWVACFGGMRVIDAGGSTICVYRPHRWQLWYSLFGGNFVPQPGSLFRASAWFKVGGLDLSYVHAMDLDLFQRLARTGRVGNVHSELAAYRRHSNTITATKPDSSEDDRIRAKYGHGRQILRGLIPRIVRDRIEFYANHASVATPGPRPASLAGGRAYTDSGAIASD